MTTLPAIGARVRIDNGAAPADRPIGTVTGHGTQYDLSHPCPPARPTVLVALDADHAGWIEPNGRPGTRGTYVSVLAAHPDNVTTL